MVKKIVDMCNHLDRIPACDGRKDEQMDGQTSCHGISRAMHTRRGKNRWLFTKNICQEPEIETSKSVS